MRRRRCSRRWRLAPWWCCGGRRSLVPGRRCYGRRWCGRRRWARRRCPCGWCRTCGWLSRRWRALGCFLRPGLGFSVGTNLFLGLRHDQRCGLRMRCSACKLHCRKRGRGKQYETKSCHDGWKLRKKSGNKLWGSTNKVRPDCGGLRRRVVFISGRRKSRCALVHCAFRRLFETELSQCPLRHIRRPRIEIGRGARQIGNFTIGGRRRRRRLRTSHRQLIGPVARQLVRPWRLAGILYGRRHLRPWTSRRAFLRRLRRLSRFDRRILLRIDRRFAHPEQRRGDGNVPLALGIMPLDSFSPRDTPPRYCGHLDRARTRRNNSDDSAHECPVRRCRVRPRPSQPCRRLRLWRDPSR